MWSREEDLLEDCGGWRGTTAETACMFVTFYRISLVLGDGGECGLETGAL